MSNDIKLVYCNESCENYIKYITYTYILLTGEQEHFNQHISICSVAEDKTITTTNKEEDSLTKKCPLIPSGLGMTITLYISALK